MDRQLAGVLKFFSIRNNKDHFASDLNSLFDYICGAAKGSYNLTILSNLISRLASPVDEILASVEKYHVDTTYRDLYYSQYARRHFDVSRFTYRVSFFDYFIMGDGTQPKENGASFDEAHNLSTWASTPTSTIQEAYLGSVVINPVAKTLICKAFLEPGRSMYWPCTHPNVNNQLIRDDTYLRLSEYRVNIAGKKLGIDAFPYHAQDGEALSCAEVTLLNLIRYYSNEYSGYPNAEPSDVLDSERLRAYSRVIPAKGMSYQTLCSILGDFGLKPEIYDQRGITRRRNAARSSTFDAQQIIHTYLESGIPIAVNVEPVSDPIDGHSLVVIGHGEQNEGLLDRARDNAVLLNERTGPVEEGTDSVGVVDLPFTIRMLHSSDLYDTYVVMDDNQDPYSVRNYSALSIHPQMQTARFIAPIQRGMTVDAIDAITRFESILRDPTDGITMWAHEWLGKVKGTSTIQHKPCVEIVTRVFLASTRRYKHYRTKSIKNISRRTFYAGIPLPHYVWVCELFLLSEYRATSSHEMRADEKDGLGDAPVPNAFAEVVIDATVSRTTSARDSELIMHFPTRLAFRLPDNPHGPMNIETDFKDLDGYEGFPAYNQNLEHVISHHQA